MAPLIISSLAVCWVVVGVFAAGLCRAARRGDVALESELEPTADQRRWVLDGERRRLITLR